MSEEDGKKLPVYKACLCGKSGVGKTSIFRQILGDGFLEDTSKFKHLAEETVEVRVKDKTIKIHLLDTAGMERYGRLTRHHYYGSHVVLLVYDCDDNESLQALKGFYKDAKDNTGGAAMVLVRNKIDKEFQSVDISETKNLVCTHGTTGISVCKFILQAETSAKENWGIKKLLKNIAEYLITTAEPSNKSDKFDEKIKLQEEKQQQTPPTQTTSSGCSC